MRRDALGTRHHTVRNIGNCQLLWAQLYVAGAKTQAAYQHNVEINSSFMDGLVFHSCNFCTIQLMSLLAKVIVAITIIECRLLFIQLSGNETIFYNGCNSFRSKIKFVYVIYLFKTIPRMFSSKAFDHNFGMTDSTKLKLSHVILRYKKAVRKLSRFILLRIIQNFSFI